MYLPEVTQQVGGSREGGTQAVSVMRLAPCSQLWGSCVCALFQGHMGPDASAMLSSSMSGSGPSLPSIKFFLKKKKERNPGIVPNCSWCQLELCGTEWSREPGCPGAWLLTQGFSILLSTGGPGCHCGPSMGTLCTCLPGPGSEPPAAFTLFAKLRCHLGGLWGFCHTLLSFLIDHSLW